MKTLKSERKRESKPSVFVNLVQRLDAVEKTMEKLMGNVCYIFSLFYIVLITL